MNLCPLLSLVALAAMAVAAGLPAPYAASSRPRNTTTYPLHQSSFPGATPPPHSPSGADYFHALANGIDSAPSSLPFIVRTTGSPRYTASVRDLPPISVNGAVGLDGKPIGRRRPRNATAAAICGANTLYASSYIQTCSLVIGFPNGDVGTCTGFIIGDRYLGTAGHCVYDADAGWVDWVEVYCDDAIGCAGQRTTLSAVVAVSSNWFQTTTSGLTNPWDGAVILAQDSLPYFPLAFGSHYGDFTTEILIAGYPGDESDLASSPCQAFSDVFTGCNQYATEGTMPGEIDNGFFYPEVDTCKGHSGSGVWDFSVQRITAIFTGSSYDPCENVAVPLLVRADVDEGCNGTEGGVSLGCLADAAASV